MFAKKIEKAKILLEALPYIQKFHNQTILIKFGGSLMENEELKAQFATDIVLLKYVGINPIVVHGGGKEISRWMNTLNYPVVFSNGLRVTDSKAIEITEMVLAGKINNEVVSLINQHGGNAVGICGKDGNLFTARKKSDELGHVGDVKQVNPKLLITLSEQGYIPIISSIALGEDGKTYNLNADTVALNIAKTLKALKLIYLTDVSGVMIENEVLPIIKITDAKKLLTHPEITGGMLPKIEGAIQACEDGIENVHIINGKIEHAVLLELFTDKGIGTMIQRST